MKEKGLIVHQQSQVGSVIDYDDRKMRETLRQTVAAGATNEELELFCQVCKSSGLNPFKKEVWFIKSKSYTKRNGDRVDGKVQIQTGINGFYEIANRNPQYDGLENEEGPLREIEIEKGKTVKAPEYVIARVYRKDRTRPQVAKAYWDEYAGELINSYGNVQTWGKKPILMLTKCADALALRKAFPQELSGLYAVEEMGNDVDFKQVDPIDPVKATIPPEAHPISIDASCVEIEPDKNPDGYKLEAPKSKEAGKSLYEIWQANPGWLDKACGDRKWRTALLTKRDIVNIDAFKKMLEEMESGEQPEQPTPPDDAVDSVNDGDDIPW
jgi:phage recombination protein Bet